MNRSSNSVNTTSADGNTGRSVGRNGKGGYGLFANKMGSGPGFHPTVIALLVLIIAEFGAYIALRYAFKSVHGG